MKYQNIHTNKSTKVLCRSKLEGLDVNFLTDAATILTCKLLHSIQIFKQEALNLWP